MPYNEDEIRMSRRSLKRRREELHAKILWAFQAENAGAARAFMLDAGYEDGDPEMQRLAEIWLKTYGYPI